MKYLWLAIPLFFLLSCKAKQPLLAENVTNKVSTNCPENGTCNLEVFQNKNLHILRDNLGETYPEIVDGNQVVLKFEFNRNTGSKAVDGHYSEEIFIELNPDDLQKETTHLKSEKLLFSRLCFCKGQTGYYRIRTGHLSVKKIKNATYQIDFSFEIDEVPQVMTSFTEIFSLK